MHDFTQKCNLIVLNVISLLFMLIAESYMSAIDSTLEKDEQKSVDERVMNLLKRKQKKT